MSCCHRSLLQMVLCCVICLFLLTPRVAGAPAGGARKLVAKSQPLQLTENKGQVADDQGRQRPDILFAARSGGLSLFIAGNRIYYQFSRSLPDNGTATGSKSNAAAGVHRFDLALEGASTRPRVRAEMAAAGADNYYLPHCPAGITGVHSYGRVVLEQVYPGIDWVIYTYGDRLKYDFLVHPGADPGLIRLRVSDADEVTIDGAGRLVLKTRLGEVREQHPVSFSGGRRIATHFIRREGSLLSFSVAAYDKRRLLRIDPTIDWGTYYGGGGEEVGRSCTTDAAGNVYLAGSTSSGNAIASAGGFQPGYGGGPGTAEFGDAFVVKFSSSGVRQWATWYGGSAEDNGNDCAVDGNGNVYLAGATASTNVIAYNGFQNASGNFLGNGSQFDAFLAKFDANGQRVWGTYYGGLVNDLGYSCGVDAMNNVFMAGTTQSNNNIAAPGSFKDTLAGSTDAFLVKFSPAGSRIWGTYYGAGGEEDGNDCAVDAAGNVYLCGTTNSDAGISAGGFQNTRGNTFSSPDAFLAKFDNSGNRIWGTYYGGNCLDMGHSCAVDNAGYVYLSGWTCSPGNIAYNGAQNTYATSGYVAFLARFDSSGARQWGTYYNNMGGGINYLQEGPVCAAGASGNVYLVSLSNYPNNVAYGGFQNTKSFSEDAVIISFSNTGAFRWSSYCGGVSMDHGRGCAVDAAGAVYMSGQGRGISLLTGGHQPVAGGGLSDGFLLKIRDRILPVLVITNTLATSYCAGANMTISYSIDSPVQAPNTFIAQLSDAAGSFATPVSIGSVSSTLSAGTIPATIPANTPPGIGYRIRVVSTNPAVTGQDNGVNIAINALPQAPGPIAGDTVLCAGSAVTYSVAQAPNTTYNWTLPGGWTGASTTGSINAVAGSTGGTIAVSSANSCGTSAASTRTAVILPAGSFLPVVQITASSLSVCAGGTVTFTATATNGGPAPVFQWRRNGTAIPGATGTAYTAVAPGNGDVFTVSMRSNKPCADTALVLSNALTLFTAPPVTPGVNVNANAPDSVCLGVPVTFYANINGGGASPRYQWYKNNSLLPGVTAATYTEMSLADRDTIQVILTSSAACAIPAAVASNRLGMRVFPVLTPSVTVTANPGTVIRPGQQVVFTAVLSQGGASPVYQWRKNGTDIPGANGITYTTAGLRDGDYISVEVVSNALCATVRKVSSQPLLIRIATSAGTPERGAVTLFPNPTGGDLEIAAAGIASGLWELKIADVLGKNLYAQQVQAVAGAFRVAVQLPAYAAPGIYFLKMNGTGGQYTYRFTVVK